MYVYAIQTPTYIKIGHWSGSISNLRSRYATYIPSFETAVFQTLNAVDCERKLHRECHPYHLGNELFSCEALPTFYSVAANQSEIFCTSTDLEAKKNACMKLRMKSVLKENTRLEKENSCLLKKIKSMERQNSSLKDTVSSLQKQASSLKEANDKLLKLVPKRSHEQPFGREDLISFLSIDAAQLLLDDRDPHCHIQHTISLGRNRRTELLTLQPVFELWCEKTGRIYAKKDLGKLTQVWTELGCTIVNKMKVIKPCPDEVCTHQRRIKESHGQWKRDVIVGLHLSSEKVAKDDENGQAL